MRGPGGGRPSTLNDLQVLPDAVSGSLSVCTRVKGELI